MAVLARGAPPHHHAPIIFAAEDLPEAALDELAAELFRGYDAEEEANRAKP